MRRLVVTLYPAGLLGLRLERTRRERCVSCAAVQHGGQNPRCARAGREARTPHMPGGNRLRSHSRFRWSLSAGLRKTYSTGDTLMATPETLPAVIRRELRRCNADDRRSWTGSERFRFPDAPGRHAATCRTRSDPHRMVGRVYARSAPRPPW